MLKTMGAATSKKEASDEVSYYTEFRTGLSDANKKILAQLSVDENGILRVPGNPFQDVLALQQYPENLLSTVRDIQLELILANMDTYDEWQGDTGELDPIEKVDLADVTDWFPFFLKIFKRSRVHITITTQLNTIKLHRVLGFLFYLGKVPDSRRLKKIVLSFDTLMAPLIEPYVQDAQTDYTQLKTTLYASAITHGTLGRVLATWKMSAREVRGTTYWTFDL